VVVYAIPKTTPKNPDALIAALAEAIKAGIGKFAGAKRIVLVPELPKTRSGKIMRRVLRKLWAGEMGDLGDLSTITDPAIVGVIRERIVKGDVKAKLMGNWHGKWATTGGVDLHATDQLHLSQPLKAGASA
ncbi:hypothetical protein BDK51DRAFT_28428, partial [Blyttiomyces helicus]